MSHTTQSYILFNKLFNEAILSVYRVTQYPPSTEAEMIQSHLVVTFFMDLHLLRRRHLHLVYFC